MGRRLLTAQETERARIARELHDDVSQQLTILKLDINLLAGMVRGEAESVADEAGNTQTALRQPSGICRISCTPRNSGWSGSSRASRD